MAYPKDCMYTEEHEWVRRDGPNAKTAKVGLTEFAARELGDIVFVEMPQVGAVFDSGKAFGTVESVKSVSELYAPVSGKITGVNEDVQDSPEDINSDANGTWLITIEMRDPKELDGLLTAAQYEAYLTEQS